MTQNLISSKLMLFELSWGGHYPEYLTHLLNYWHFSNCNGELLLVLSPQFCQKHSEVVSLVKDKVSLIPITSAEEKKLVLANSFSKRIIRAFQEFKLACQYARQLQASEILFTYFDTRQFPLALSQELPCPCSGIYFRPRFHYHHLTKEQIDWREKLIRWQEKWLLKAALKNPQLKCIFSLDPFAIKYFPPISNRVKAVALPDPVEINTQISCDRKKLKTDLKIEPKRTVFLLFGGLTKRKGILPLLKALALLPIEIGQKICLLLVGSISEEFKQQIQPQIATITQTNAVQIISEYRYVTKSETQQYFQLADVILALYQRHVGMSGIILRAAAAQKPVISTNYGLMGEITRRHRLGLTLDSTNPQAIAEGIEQLAKSPREFIDCHSAKQFVHQNSAVNFARTIFHQLGFTQ
jgi:glycosyltransferase involved in cell wall biosynthesis